jgi:hypothetical protein
MKVLTYSQRFPKGHPKAGQPTYFVEKVMACLADVVPGWKMKNDFVQYDWYEYYNCTMPKGHTVRIGNHWKAGDMASLRVWSGLPYRSKQIEFAQVEIKKVWAFELRPVKVHLAREIEIYGFINDELVTKPEAKLLASNDGLTVEDFESWFCPDGTKFILSLPIFTGQIICWSDKINY